uniref:Uncharacterized protein n=1 Tax=Vespula pensylvanica TaxID=30213 RepID=A0A834KJC3_VESPE|nr:hypothetical protein H0235_014633 [Vespula pensylvanica]
MKKSLLKSTHVSSSTIVIVVVVVVVVVVVAVVVTVILVVIVVVVVLIHTGVYANSRFSPPPSPSTLSPSHPLRDTPKGRLESVLATSLHARPNVVTMSDQNPARSTRHHSSNVFYIAASNRACIGWMSQQFVVVVVVNDDDDDDDDDEKKMQTEARLNSASFARLRRINVGGANQPLEFLLLKEEEKEEEEEEEGDRREETIEKMMSVVPTLASCEQQPDYMDSPESLFGIIKAREKLGKIQQTIYLHDYVF